jgi:hypothetical protein
MTDIERAQEAQIERQNRLQARYTALKCAPTRKDDANGISINMTAEEIVQASELIYQWLIKDLE